MRGDSDRAPDDADGAAARAGLLGTGGIHLRSISQESGVSARASSRNRRCVQPMLVLRRLCDRPRPQALSGVGVHAVSSPARRDNLWKCRLIRAGEVCGASHVKPSATQ
jgi:hypothetical protein